jgi:hypothetical protein
VTNIAELSVIVTGSVALGVPLITGGLAELQSRRDARSQRLDELRSVLDDASVALLAFMDTVLTIDENPDRETMTEHLRTMETAARKIWQQEARIAVRLGVEDPVYEAYRAAHDVSADYVIYVRDKLRSGTATTTMTEIASRQSTAYGQFFTAAASLTGPNRR